MLSRNTASYAFSIQAGCAGLEQLNCLQPTVQAGVLARKPAFFSCNYCHSSALRDSYFVLGVVIVSILLSQTSSFQLAFFQQLQYAKQHPTPGKGVF